VKSLFASIFPPPRRRPTVRDFVPMVVLVALFAAVCLTLEIRETIVFSRLWPFGLLLLLAPWLWWMHLASFSGLARLRSMCAALLRMGLLFLFIVVLADPQAVRKHDRMATIYAVDLSASIAESASKNALNYVMRTANEKPQRDEAALVFFGRDAAVELPPATSLPFEDVNVDVDRDGSNLAGALALCAAMISDERQGRIVLISDGVETEGDLGSVLDDLKARGIPVDVLPIKYAYDREVWLERLELPRFVKVNQTYNASVILSSLQAGEGTLKLTENGHEIFHGPVSYAAGKNRFELPIRMQGAGFFEYVAKISVLEDDDTWAQNNEAISFLHIKGKGRILLVTDSGGDKRDWLRLERALAAARREVDRIKSVAAPTHASALLPYDCIIVPNVPADALTERQMQAMHDAVFHQGSGLIMIGGPNSFGPGGYRGTPIEDALPVEMDISQKKVLPKGALAIILHTCEFPQGNEWAKRITKRAMKVLDSRDEVGALAYGLQGGDGWIFPLTPAGEYDALAKLVNAAQIGDMLSFVPTMTLGLNALKASDAAAKHMIIISDGDPSPPPPALVKSFIAAKVSISMVAIFPHGGADVGKMRSVAAATGGRYYHPKDPAKLPGIFIKEAKTIRRSAIQEKTFVPVTEHASPLIKGIESFEPLRGYVLTMPKPRSTVVLRAPESEELEPVLSTWRYGVGASAAFTSDLSPAWGAQWIEWDHYEPFVRQLVNEVSRPVQTGTLRTRSFPVGGDGMVYVDDHGSQQTFLQMYAQVEGPKSTTATVPLQQVGPRRYEGRFPLTGMGHYQITVSAVPADAEGTVQRVASGFVVPYSPEFRRFRSNPIVLERIARRSGGRLLSGSESTEQIYDVDRQVRHSARSIIDWMLMVLACLVPLDVGLRRVQFDFTAIRAWMGIGRSAQPSAQMFSALMARKKDVAQTLSREPDALEVPSAAPEDEPLPAAPPKAPGGSEPAATPQTTMQRLMEARKRAREQQEDRDK
jgi:uncharacterized membrane protein